VSKGYQRRGWKSNGLRPRGRGRFKLLGGREVKMRMPLPLAEVWEELQAKAERLAGEAGP
jgi:hypothetical protein